MAATSAVWLANLKRMLCTPVSLNPVPISEIMVPPCDGPQNGRTDDTRSGAKNSAEFWFMYTAWKLLPSMCVSM